MSCFKLGYLLYSYKRISSHTQESIIRIVNMTDMDSTETVSVIRLPKQVYTQVNITENPSKNQAAYIQPRADTVGDSPKLGRQLIGRSGVS